MKIYNFIKDEAEKIISFFPHKHKFHSYKYCTSINISKNVSNVIRSRQINDVQEKIKILEKIYN